ncbi:MAG: CoA-binding protein [Ignavibacteria bacterium]|nr:CoA-binding protein [Ignavibacteria bacterium]
MSDLIKELLTKSHSIAVIGIKPDESSAAYKIPHYMQSNGYKIFPVNPKYTGSEILDEDVYSTVSEIGEPVDIVNIFRKPEYLLQHAEEILSMNKLPKYVWFQLGIRNDEAASLLENSGIHVVQNRCIMVEYIRYLGS